MLGRKANKWKNKKVEYQGIVFDSAKERDRYIVLQSRQAQGLISDLQHQVKYVVIPQLSRLENIALKTKTKTVKKVLFPETKYIADFVYTDIDGKQVVEDVKGAKIMITPEFKLKQKLMLHVHNIEVKIVFNPNE